MATACLWNISENTFYITNNGMDKGVIPYISIQEYLQDIAMGCIATNTRLGAKRMFCKLYKEIYDDLGSVEKFKTASNKAFQVCLAKYF